MVLDIPADAVGQVFGHADVHLVDLPGQGCELGLVVAGVEFGLDGGEGALDRGQAGVDVGHAALAGRVELRGKGGELAEDFLVTGFGVRGLLGELGVEAVEGCAEEVELVG